MHRGLLIALAALAVLAAVVVSLLGTMRPAQAQDSPYPVTLTMTGPTMAVAGQEVTYVLRYQLIDPATTPKTAIVISFTQGATYVSTQVISGTPGVLGHHGERNHRWSDLGSSAETEGEIEMVVRMDADFRGSVFSFAHIPGTETTSSNAVETQVFAQGMLPQAGSGATSASAPLMILALILSGAVILTIGTIATLARRAGSRRHGVTATRA